MNSRKYKKRAKTDKYSNPIVATMIPIMPPWELLGAQENAYKSVLLFK
jgi:hypothetical protein